MKDEIAQLVECNMDWSATAAIYVDETSTAPLLHGFCGSVRLTLNSASSIAFCRRVTQDYKNYRYFDLQNPPILKIALDYIHCATNDMDDNSMEQVLPRNVRLVWEYYPPELPEHDRISLLGWLTKRCNQKLEEENELLTMCASFSIVELCEHETWSFWETIHQDCNDGYRLILLPPKLDHLYHANVGTLIDPRSEALKLGTSMTTTKEKKKTLIKTNNLRPSIVQEYPKHALLDCWKKLYMITCPICLDTTNCDKGVTLPCGDFFCEDCFPMYLHVKVTEIGGYRTNPFLCPAEKCRQEISIEDIVQQHLSKRDNQKVIRWQTDLKYPLCYSLDQCLCKACTEETLGLQLQQQQQQQQQPDDDDEEEKTFCMRRRSTERKNSFIFCDACDKTWCELCLKRIRKGVTREDHKEVCESQVALKFCRRYLRATKEQKETCELKFPWIVIYARARQHDVEAIQWILENGQCCPNCATGVERIEGCFHMKCPTCATHFCYECGKSSYSFCDAYLSLLVARYLLTCSPTCQVKNSRLPTTVLIIVGRNRKCL